MTTPPTAPRPTAPARWWALFDGDQRVTADLFGDRFDAADAADAFAGREQYEVEVDETCPDHRDQRIDTCPRHLDDVDYVRPAHDAIAALIWQALDGRAPHLLVGTTEHHVAGLFAALHAVDATRYAVRPSMLAGVRASGYDVIDTWLDESIEWCAGHAQADRLAAEQNALNADDAAAELATTLDIHVAA